MDFLKEVGFSDEEIEFLNGSIPPLIYNQLVSRAKLVIVNIKYLKDNEILNYREIFSKFYEIFLLDYSEFMDIFEKYDKADLIKYLKNDLNIIEYL